MQKCRINSRDKSAKLCDFGITVADREIGSRGKGRYIFLNYFCRDTMASLVTSKFVLHSSFRNLIIWQYVCFMLFRTAISFHVLSSKIPKLARET